MVHGSRLNPEEALVKDFGLTENCYVHCVVTAAPPRLRLPSLTPEQAAEEASAHGILQTKLRFLVSN